MFSNGEFDDLNGRLRKGLRPTSYGQGDGEAPVEFHYVGCERLHGLGQQSETLRET